MSRISTTQLEKKAAFEASYYGDMPDEVKQLADLRNEGIDLVRARQGTSSVYRGVDMLAESYEGLSSVLHRYRRERFASEYMYARARLLVRDYDFAGVVALQAVEDIPEVPEELSDFVIADQYVAIASGRLSLILSSAGSGTSMTIAEKNDARMPAIEAARLARRTCRHSEDRVRMLFPNGEMTETERKAKRREHTISAIAATAGLWVPTKTTRLVAEKNCA
ncbi:hypothetical protein H6800_02510 [Candidatus Nomurabacteria bacterium]|nr:hypothetical protein [Candidatus Nomurabacteria bacterium]